MVTSPKRGRDAPMTAGETPALLSGGIPSPSDSSDAHISAVVFVTFVVISVFEASFFRVGNRSGDHVSAARPLAQVNQAASFGAERELRIAAQHYFLASRAAQAANFLLRHGGFCNWLRGNLASNALTRSFTKYEIT